MNVSVSPRYRGSQQFAQSLLGTPERLHILSYEQDHILSLLRKILKFFQSALLEFSVLTENLQVQCE